MLRQLRRLDLKDQANVLQLLLAERASASRASRPPSAGDASEASELQALRELGAVELQAMAVARLQGTRCAAGTRYSVAHLPCFISQGEGVARSRCAARDSP